MDNISTRLENAVKKRTLTSLKSSLSPTDRARILSLGSPPASTSASIAGQWLTSLPTRDEYTLNGPEFCQAARHRLGLKPSDDMPLAICMCNQGNFNVDAQHFHSCPSLKRLPVLTRHNAIAQVIANTASRTHMNVAHEFIGRQLVADMQPSQPVQHDESEHSGVPDLVITGPGCGAFVDVAVSNPSAASYAHHAQNTYSYAAQLRAKAKHQRYDAMCESKQLDMVPFCLESTGVIHSEAYDFLVRICMNADVAIRSALLKHALISLSFALQRGNAQISFRGLALLRLRVVQMPNRRVRVV
jgi:hypothetical protein